MAIRHPGRDYADFQKVPKPLRPILRQAEKREWRHLAEERIENMKPHIPLGPCFWPLSAKEKREIHRLFETKDVGTRTRPAQMRMHERLRAWGFRVEVPRSVVEGMAIVKEMIEMQARREPAEEKKTRSRSA